ncbi:alpha/beta hydrolase [Pontibacter sp. JH31]|uniref:Alpha/beta hydrolase n=1 Tax=Pontibacter aquaedesilientis TaxID=2766980 RepID=A0ABR7XGG4_9BACT|nr:alpha/beta hydrolase [Pontibacter aquaedesilientis]MBD1397359.1 alpha/beta hydrolase [Pontibacter aquaedesilientis]
MQHLLLLHGALGSAETLQPLQEALAPHYTVHTLNFSGHGGEPLPQAPFRIEQFAADVLRYLDRCDLLQVDVFGYSMGGYVALYLALYHPARIKCVFTLATKFAWSPETAAKEVKLLQPEKIQEKVPQFASMLAKRHAPTDWQDVVLGTADMMQHLGQQPLLTADTLPNINARVRVCVGDRDNMVSVEETSWAFRLLCNGSLLVLPDTRHPLEMADTKRLLQEIRQFFAPLPV